MIDLDPNFRVRRGSSTFRWMLANTGGWGVMSDIERNIAHKRLGYANYVDRRRWTRKEVARYLGWKTEEVKAVELSAFSKLLFTANLVKLSHHETISSG